MKLRTILVGILFALVLAYSVVNFYDAAALQFMLDERGWNAWPDERGGAQRVRWAVDAASALQEGDEIIAVNGQNVERSDYKMENAFRRVRSGDAYTVTVRRGGELREFTLRRESRSFLKFLLRPLYVILLLTPLIYFLLGFSVFALKPDDKQALLLSLCLVMFASSWAMPQPFDDRAWWFAFLIVAGKISKQLFFAFFLHLLLVFPEPSPVLLRRPRLEWLLYLPVLLFLIPVSAYDMFLWVAAPEEWLTFNVGSALLRNCSTVIGLSYVACGLLALALKYRQSNGMSRRKLRIVLAAMLVCWVPFIVWVPLINFVPPARNYAGVGWTITNVLSWAMPLAFAYAIVRHQVIPVSLMIRRSVQYLLAKNALRLAILLPVVGIILSVALNPHRTLAEILFRNSFLFYVFVALAAALGLVFRRRLAEWIDRKFFRETYNAERLLRELTDDIKRLDSIPEMSKHVGTQLERALHPTRSFLFYRDAERRDLSLTYTSGGASDELRVPEEFRLLRFMEDAGGAQDFPFPPKNNLPEAEKEWLRQLGARLIVPLTGTDARLAGLLLLGEKRSEVPYTASDRELLESLAAQIAIVYENVRLKERVERDRKIQHEVLSRVGDRNINLLKECARCGRCYDREAQRCEVDGGELVLSLPVERTIENRYRLDRVIGRGGMGAVYEATDERLNRAVAVKILSGNLFGDQAALSRFEREAQAAARLSHPNIIQVHDYGATSTEGAFLVMELARGRTMKDALKAAGAVGGQTAAAWFDQILEGVKAAHAQGVVHRDLKPENVLIERCEGGREAIKILDFGLAKFTQTANLDAARPQSLTTPGMVMGTFGYMSPEQLAGGEVDRRSDLFSIGVMAAEALTGERPYKGRTVIELMRSMQHDEFHLAGDSPEAERLEAVLRKALAKEPAARFASAAEMQREMIPTMSAYNFRPAPPAHPTSDADTLIAPH